MKQREPDVTGLKHHIDKIPTGTSIGRFQGASYQITKHTFNNGKSFKIFARELGGNDFISLNYYCLKAGHQLRPCEMPAEKVILFLEQATVSTE